MTERTTVRLPEKLLARAKEKAAAEGRTLTSLIEEGLRVILAPRPDAQKKERLLPRISKARGGPRPGVDLVKTSKLLVDFDTDDINKMR
jgi:Ribbon-helix-helix protein, copG family